MIYFTAKWNPACAQIERDYENLTAQYPAYHHIRVDCDAFPKVKRYFDARLEPSFLVLLNGGEVERFDHYNFDKIGMNLERISSLHSSGLGYIGNTKDTWERFYDEFDKWAKYGEYDKDSMRIQIDSIADTHRGPGTENP